MTPTERLKKAKSLLDLDLITQSDFDEIKRSCLEEMGLLPSEEEDVPKKQTAEDSSLTPPSDSTPPSQNDPADHKTPRWKKLKNDWNTALKDWAYGHEDFRSGEEINADASDADLDAFEKYVQRMQNQREWVKVIRHLEEECDLDLPDPAPLGGKELTQWIKENLCKVSQLSIDAMQETAKKDGTELKPPPKTDPNAPTFSLSNFQKEIGAWMRESYAHLQSHKWNVIQESLAEVRKDWDFGYRKMPPKPEGPKLDDFLEAAQAYIRRIQSQKKEAISIQELAAFSKIDLADPPPLGTSEMPVWLNENYCHLSRIQMERMITSSKAAGLTLSDPPKLDPDAADFSLEDSKKDVTDWMKQNMVRIKENTEKLRKMAEAAEKRNKAAAKMSIAQAKQKAKQTGKNVPHPSKPNLCYNPKGELTPASGYLWVDPHSDDDMRVKPKPPKPKLPKTPMSQMPVVDGPVRGPGGFFSSVKLYRVQFKIDAFEPDDPGGLVAATSPYQAVAALFRNNDNRRICLSWHTGGNLLWDMFIRYAIIMGDFEARHGYDREELVYYVDPIGADIQGAIDKGWVKVTRITSRSMLSNAEKDEYLPYNTDSDDHYAEDYI